MSALEEFTIELEDGKIAFSPGELLRGSLLLTLTEPMEMDRMKLQLLGQARFHANRPVTEAKASKKKDQPYGTKNKEEIVNLEIILFGNKPEETSSYVPSHPAGSYGYLFEFPLPSTLPASFESPDNHILGTIRYKVSGIILRPLKSRIHTFTPIIINEAIPPEDSVVQFRPGCEVQVEAGDACFPSGFLSVEGYLEKGCYIQGDDMHITATARNETSRVMNAVYAKLFKRTRYRSKESTKTYQDDIAASFGKLVKPRKFVHWDKLKFPIPMTTPTISRSKVIQVDYFLRVGIYEMYGKEAHIDLPIVIGTVRKVDEDQEGSKPKVLLTRADLNKDYWRVTNVGPRTTIEYIKSVAKKPDSTSAESSPGKAAPDTERADEFDPLSPKKLGDGVKPIRRRSKPSSGDQSVDELIDDIQQDIDRQKKQLAELGRSPTRHVPPLRNDRLGSPSKKKPPTLTSPDKTLELMADKDGGYRVIQHRHPSPKKQAPVVGRHVSPRRHSEDRPVIDTSLPRSRSPGERTQSPSRGTQSPRRHSQSPRRGAEYPYSPTKQRDRSPGKEPWQSPGGSKSPIALWGTDSENLNAPDPRRHSPSRAPYQIPSKQEGRDYAKPDGNAQGGSTDPRGSPSPHHRFHNDEPAGLNDPLSRPRSVSPRGRARHISPPYGSAEQPRNDIRREESKKTPEKVRFVNRGPTEIPPNFNNTEAPYMSYGHPVQSGKDTDTSPKESANDSEPTKDDPINKRGPHEPRPDKRTEQPLTRSNDPQYDGQKPYRNYPEGDRGEPRGDKLTEQPLTRSHDPQYDGQKPYRNYPKGDRGEPRPDKLTEQPLTQSHDPQYDNQKPYRNYPEGHRGDPHSEKQTEPLNRSRDPQYDGRKPYRNYPEGHRGEPQVEKQTDQPLARSRDPDYDAYKPNRSYPGYPGARDRSDPADRRDHMQRSRSMSPKKSRDWPYGDRRSRRRDDESPRDHSASHPTGQPYSNRSRSLSPRRHGNRQLLNPSQDYAPSTGSQESLQQPQDQRDGPSNRPDSYSPRRLPTTAGSHRLGTPSRGQAPRYSADDPRKGKENPSLYRSRSSSPKPTRSNTKPQQNKKNGNERRSFAKDLIVNDVIIHAGRSDRQPRPKSVLKRSQSTRSKSNPPPRPQQYRPSSAEGLYPPLNQRNEPLYDEPKDHDPTSIDKFNQPAKDPWKQRTYVLPPRDVKEENPNESDAKDVYYFQSDANDDADSSDHAHPHKLSPSHGGVPRRDADDKYPQWNDKGQGGTPRYPGRFPESQNKPNHPHRYDQDQHPHAPFRWSQQPKHEQDDPANVTPGSALQTQGSPIFHPRDRNSEKERRGSHPHQLSPRHGGDPSRHRDDKYPQRSDHRQGKEPRYPGQFPEHKDEPTYHRPHSHIQDDPRNEGHQPTGDTPLGPHDRTHDQGRRGSHPHQLSPRHGDDPSRHVDEKYPQRSDKRHGKEPRYPGQPPELHDGPKYRHPHRHDQDMHSPSSPGYLQHPHGDRDDPKKEGYHPNEDALHSSPVSGPYDRNNEQGRMGADPHLSSPTHGDEPRRYEDDKYPKRTGEEQGTGPRYPGYSPERQYKPSHPQDQQTPTPWSRHLDQEGDDPTKEEHQRSGDGPQADGSYPNDEPKSKQGRRGSDHRPLKTATVTLHLGGKHQLPNEGKDSDGKRKDGDDIPPTGQHDKNPEKETKLTVRPRALYLPSPPTPYPRNAKPDDTPPGHLSHQSSDGRHPDSSDSRVFNYDRPYPKLDQTDGGYMSPSFEGKPLRTSSPYEGKDYGRSISPHARHTATSPLDLKSGAYPYRSGSRTPYSSQGGDPGITSPGAGSYIVTSPNPNVKVHQGSGPSYSGSQDPLPYAHKTSPKSSRIPRPVLSPPQSRHSTRSPHYPPTAAPRYSRDGIRYDDFSTWYERLYERPKSLTPSRPSYVSYVPVRKSYTAIRPTRY